MAAATHVELSDYDRAVAWQKRSIEIAERDELVATRHSYGETCQMFTVPSRSNPRQAHILTLYTAGAHNGQLFCPCAAQAHGLPCAHVGAVLLLLDYERANMQTWLDATAGYQDEMPAASTADENERRWWDGEKWVNIGPELVCECGSRHDDLRGHGATPISREAW